MTAGFTRIGPIGDKSNSKAVLLALPAPEVHYTRSPLSRQVKAEEISRGARDRRVHYPCHFDSLAHNHPHRFPGRGGRDDAVRRQINKIRSASCQSTSLKNCLTVSAGMGLLISCFLGPVLAILVATGAAEQSICPSQNIRNTPNVLSDEKEGNAVDRHSGECEKRIQREEVDDSPYTSEGNGFRPVMMLRRWRYADSNNGMILR
jgi:hypothetical protein